MGAVRVSEVVPGTVHEVETLWYDTTRWASWVEGLAEVTDVAGDWPAVGSSVRWISGPAGRGHVLERVTTYQPLDGQALEIEDDSIRGRQEVAFTALEQQVEVALSLDYELRKRSILTPLIDFLFIRRAVANSLRATLGRFAAELAGSRGH